MEFKPDGREAVTSKGYEQGKSGGINGLSVPVRLNDRQNQTLFRWSGLNNRWWSERVV